MEKIEFSVHLISPMFLAGAENRGKPEWRGASIRGKLRYWWRAIQAEPDLRRLRLREQQIFGGTERFGERPEEQARKSPFSVQVEEVRDNIENREPLVLHDLRKGAGSVFFPQREAPPQVDAKIHLRWRSHSPFINERFLRDLTYAAFTLGGLGKRARRGLGAVQLLRVNQTPISYPSPKTLLEVLNRLRPEGGYTEKNGIILGPQFLHSPPPYPFIRKIVWATSERASPKAEPLVRLISQKTHDYKETFGSSQYETEMGKAHGGRFASPFYVSLVASESGFLPLITLLYAVPHKDHPGHMKETVSAPFIKDITGK